MEINRIDRSLEKFQITEIIDRITNQAVNAVCHKDSYWRLIESTDPWKNSKSSTEIIDRITDQAVNDKLSLSRKEEGEISLSLGNEIGTASCLVRVASEISRVVSSTKSAERWGGGGGGSRGGIRRKAWAGVVAAGFG